MRGNVTAVSLLTLTLSLPGCDEKPKTTSFNSSDLAAARLPASISTRDPVIIKMDDGNLMCITQADNRIHFYKTSSGYAEGGLELNLKVAGGAVDVPAANLYMEVNFLEALAYFDYDWKRLYEPVASQYESNSHSVEPKNVDRVLRRLVTPGLKQDGTIDPNYQPILAGIEEDSWVHRTLERKPLAEEELTSLTFELPTMPSTEEAWAEVYRSQDPIYIRLDDGNLLKIGAKGYEEFEFLKTSEGYTVIGGKVHVAGFGVGGEIPGANYYCEISAREAVVLLGDRLDFAIERARIQDKILSYTIDPEQLEKALRSVRAGKP